MALMRTVSWGTDLMSYVSSVMDKPFEWGVTDCGTLVSSAQEAMYGHDVVGAGTWKTKAEALKALKQIGPYKEALASAGACEVPISFRQRGDIALLPDADHEGFPGLGIVVSHGVLTVDEVVMILPLEVDATIMRFPNG